MPFAAAPLLLALTLLLVAGGAAMANAPARPAELWFDPTQLPSFTGTVERYLTNPAGETDALLFREGPQVVFPPTMAAAVQREAPPGGTLIVWGIRARQAPVITALAFARSQEATPRLMERLYWQPSGREPQERMVPLEASGKVRQPYYTPQGAVAGAILEDGTVILLPRNASDEFGELLRPGARLAATGPGTATEAGRALLAERIGPEPDALRPSAPANTPR
jgi:hypothetical protein